MSKKRITFFIIYFFSFLFTLAASVSLYIQSSYLEQYVGVDFVGMAVAAATLVSLVCIFIFPYFIKKFTNYYTTLFLVVLLALSNWFLAMAHNIGTVIAFYILHILSINLLYITIDVFLENITDNERSGKIRSTLLTIINASILVSPFIMGELVNFGGYEFVYFGSLAVIIPLILFLLISKKYLEDHTKYESRHLHELLVIFYERRDLGRIFKVAFVLRIFYCVMVLYMPIYLYNTIGFSWEQIGLIFTIMLLPFVIFQLPAGNLADRYFGEKEILILGMIIMMVATGSLFFLNSASFIAWSAILFLTRVGASLVEAMQDVYFFKIVTKRDMDLINLFRDVRPLAWLITSLATVVILAIFPVKYLFLILAVVILIGLRPALLLKDTK